MFGLKWLWKSNKQNIDTSNFVSKEFLTSTLRDYVLNNSLNTTLSDYITNSVLINTLSNYVTTNTNQLIIGYKTFDTQTTFNTVRFNLSGEVIKFRSDFNDRPFYMGWYNGSTRLAWFGKGSGNSNDITLQSNSNVVLSANSKIKMYSPVELGTTITAGYGGRNVKFIPEDNSTKTLQFYNSSPSDTRRFNLLIPEPTTGNNPATKNYVDTTKTDLQSQIDINSGDITHILNKLGVNIKQTNLTIDPNYVYSTNWGELNGYYFNTTTIKNIKLLGAVVHYGAQTGNAAKAHGWMFNYGTAGTGNNIYFTFKKSKTDTTPPPVWNQTTVKVFYIDNLTTRDNNENEEIFKFVKEGK